MSWRKARWRRDCCLDIILEREYETQLVEHAYIEPEAAVAVPEPGRRGITVYGSIQNPFSCRKALSQCWDLSSTNQGNPGIYGRVLWRQG